jgi:sterol desaturase/sphingolipid hydroxylase (fatty acid hydroxylase superfamily)
MNEFLLRCVLSGSIAMALYFVAASLVARFWTRDVSRSVLRHDVKLGLISLAFGSPVLQVFALGAEKYHFSRMYTGVASHGLAYWLLSLPLYVLCWDLVFYLTHLVLHWPLVYRKSHFRHHACRPPVPWSGIAIDPLETILSGILPYTVPLFFFPFHIYTVYALNIALMFWATLVHSSLNWSNSPIFMTTQDHNLHHTYGLKNCNFAAVFTFWDRAFGTLNRKAVPPWWGKKSWSPKVGIASKKPTDGPDMPPIAAPGALGESSARAAEE